MKQGLVDANVILRFLLNDPPEMAQESAQLFQAVADGKVVLFVEDIVVAEVVWVLQSFYKKEVTQIASILREFLLQDGIETRDESTLLQALALFDSKNVDFIDALLAIRIQRWETRQLISFDKHFDRLPGVKRFTPVEFLAADET